MKKLYFNLQFFANPDPEPQPQEGDNPEDAVQALIDLRANTVPKEQYEKLVAENRKLLKSFINGEDLANELNEPKRTDDELRKKMNDENCSNLDYAKAVLELRNSIIDQGKPDPFLPIGYEVVPSEEDKNTAQKVADVLQECVDVANGDSNIFTLELQRRLIDVPLPKRK